MIHNQYVALTAKSGRTRHNGVSVNDFEQQIEDYMKFCCSTFKRYYENDNSGFCIRFSEPLTDFFCAIQFRSIEKGDEKNINTPQKIILVSNMVIQRCPFCGKNVSRYRKFHTDLFQNEAEMYRVGLKPEDYSE